MDKWECDGTFSKIVAYWLAEHRGGFGHIKNIIDNLKRHSELVTKRAERGNHLCVTTTHGDA
jgi:hypothetical protein